MRHTDTRVATMRLPLAAALAVVSLATGLAFPSAGAPAASATVSAPRPVVDGAVLRDARTGARWIPHGVNWPGFEYSCVQGWVPGYSTQEATAIASWGIDLVRLPLNQDCWLGADGAPTAGSGTASDYRARVAQWVSMLHTAGLAVILDLHWSAPAGTRADGQRAMADAQSAQFWSSVATAYATDPSVMFELYNEPYSFWNPDGSGYAFDLSWSCWRDGGCQAPVEADTATSLSGEVFAVVGMAELVDTVRAAGATQPILLGGRNYANDLGEWLSWRPDDDQLVAAWHNYQGQGCSTACWNSTITTVSASVPVLMTEFGDTTGGHAYFDSVVTWAQSHAIGVIPWAWWDVDASESVVNSRYSLYDGDFVPRAPSGTAYRTFLASLTAPATDAATAFILACYTDVLGRTPSPTGSEVTSWRTAMANGSSRSSVAGGFTGSDEYRLKMIDAAYQDVLGRAADPDGRGYWLSAMYAGLLQPDDVHRIFLTSDEFYNVAGNGTARGYITAIYADVLGRTADAGGMATWSAVLASRGRAAVVDGIWMAEETLRKRVVEAYTILLGRTPAVSEQAAWAAYARGRGPTAMRTSIMASDEYWNRARSRFP
ncbi:MAG: cellulase family glycosylhydrolase [Protaetiibacter sp.]